MIKKTKLKKGGKTFLEKTLGNIFEGSLVADNVYDNIKRKKGTELLNEYKLRKDIAQLDYEIAQGRKDHSDELNEKLKDRNFKYDKLNSQNLNYRLKLFGDILNSIWKGIGFIINKFKDFLILIPRYFVVIRDTIYGLINLIRGIIGVGQGAIVKVIILIILLILIIVGIASIFGNSSNSNSSILNKVSLNVFTTTETPSFTMKFNSILKSFIPESIIRQFNNINDRFNKILGKDIKATSINRKNRENINEGRYNGITNIKIENDNERIYSIIKPKEEQIIEIKLEDYKENNIDFNKIPNKIQKDILKNNNIIKIEFKLDKFKKNNNEIYRYLLKDKENNILENDKNIINKYNIKSKDVNSIIIKENEKNKYMFNFKNDKFVYPENIGTNIF